MANGNGEVLNTGELERRLHNKYHGDDFALCFDVRNDAGFHASRAADAMGIGLWPSRGCHLYGFEIKASRTDWLKELKNAAKAEAFIPYCDYWYIVAGSREIVKPGELPEGWGLIVPRGEGLEIVTPAATNPEPRKMPRGMLAALVKRAQTQNPNAGVLKQAFEKGEKVGFERGKNTRPDNGHELERLRALRVHVDSFHKATGIDVEYTYDTKLLLKAMALVRAERALGRANQDVRTIANQLRNALTMLDKASGDITEAFKETAGELASANSTT